MLKCYHHIVGSIFRFFDACVTGLAWLGAYCARFRLPMIGGTQDLASFQKYFDLIPLMIVLWSTIFKIAHELTLLLKAHLIGCLGFISITYFFIGTESRIECDLYYPRNWSYFLNIKTLVSTIRKGFINQNAY
jgi:hypothetical protein